MGIVRFLVWLGASAALLTSIGCAYRAGGGDRQIPGGYRQIAVPVFQNATHETGVEVYFTNSIIREIERARVGRITDQNEAQVKLEGVVDSIQYIAESQIQQNESDATTNFLPDQTILTTKYRILVTTTLRLRRISDQTILWEGSFTGERWYDAPKIGAAGINTANALYNHSARYQNIQSMAIDMMAEAHDRLTENF